MMQTTISITYRTETDDYIVERNSIVLHVASSLESLLEWVRVWGAQARGVPEYVQRLTNEYGTLAQQGWITVLAPYAGLRDWEYVLRLYRTASAGLARSNR